MLQTRLLEALETTALPGRDGTSPRPLDVRILATTSRDLAEEIRAGRFHEGLYWRLQPLQIELPPLRERGVDRALLLNYFLERTSEALGHPKRMLSPTAYRALERYRWPGNVEELAERIRSAVLLGGEGSIELADLGFLPEQLSPLLPLAEAREHFARGYVREAVERCGGDVQEAAKKLRIGVAALRRYLQAPTGGKEEGDSGGVS